MTSANIAGVDHVAIVVKGYPRLSETFIAQEILGIQQAGIPYRIVSLRHPTDKKRHPIHGRITGNVDYLPEYLHDEPLRVLAGWWKARRMPGYRAAMAAWWRDFARDKTRNRIRRLGQAMVMAAELPADITRIYAHFLHTPASVARYGAMMRQLPWACSAHAKDIYTSPDWEMREKLAAMDWLVTCTRANVDHLKALAEDPAKVNLLYHGLDFSRFPEDWPERPLRDGSNANDPVIILSVGRLVGKKGYDDLLRALAKLPGNLHWRFVHIGGGKGEKYQALAQELGFADKCDWQGPQDQAEVIAACQKADLFVLASRIEKDGDRDGLPNVLMEAQLCGLAAVSTRISAIPELIRDGVNGLLVPQRDENALAVALQDMICDPAKRIAMGQAGNDIVRRDFSFHAGMRELGRRFGIVTVESPEITGTDNITATRQE
ncbi:glycosyltransferase family 4 protein [Thalassospira marina]|uniref:Colanic acid biosynthesis glycosyltransferase WcaL n=1 Tax=Thalassospira marina TaxID=2048283 RepID=A0ABN5FMJ5_9PROT|nr:glycosyltransferase family 4 protein [Thalassospira marina]AUG52734.1 colanic acid biosynthesis glycosyltransferase WcaL [Thalassospira marina]